MIDCKKLHELLTDYLDEELKQVVLQDLEQHMARCPDCTMHVDSVKKVIRLYREATATDLPVDIKIRLHDVLKKAREETD